MRVTKDRFMELVNAISNGVRKPLFLIPINDKMYLSPYNDTIKCQDFYYLCIYGGLTRDNYEKLMAFKSGLEVGMLGENYPI